MLNYPTFFYNHEFILCLTNMNFPMFICYKTRDYLLRNP